jgi:hypothetical protein
MSAIKFIYLIAFLGAVYSNQILTLDENEDWNYDQHGSDWTMGTCANSAA